jgi:Prophage minor tail protein Z (GPZ)
MATKPITVRLQANSLRKVLAAGDRPARKAAVDAINLAVRGERKKVYRRAGQALGIPQKFIRRRTYDSKARLSRPAYVFRVITHGINLATLGAVKSKRVRGLQKGAKIKARGAFLGTRPSGKPAAYRRKGPERKPLEWVALPIHDVVDQAVGKLSKRALNTAMRRHYKRQLAYRQAQARR